MTRWFESRVFWGVLLVLGGFAFLLQNLGYLTFGGLFWALLFGLGGLFFLSFFFQGRENWWAVIPGMALISISALMALESLLPLAADSWGGAIVLGGIALSFVIIYLISRQNWWAIIPAGVLLTLTLVILLESFFSLETGGIFFLGLGLTFALVALLPTPEGRMTWAWIPAGILLVLGVLIFAAVERLFNYIWPLILIIAGGVMILRTLRAR